MNTKRKNILFVVTESQFEGRQKYIYDIVTNLNKITFESKVCVGGSGTFIERLHDKNIPVLTVYGLTRHITIIGDFLSFISLATIIFSEKPDILHLNSTKTGIFGTLIGRIYNGWQFLFHFNFSHSIHIIFTAHGWAFKGDRLKLTRFFIKYTQWVTILLSHITIAVSKDTKKDMSHLPFIQDKIIVIHNGISKEVLRHKQLARRELFPQGIPSATENAIWIGTISNLNKNKGIATTVHAIAQLPQSSIENIIFIVIGNDYGEKKNIQRLITKHKLNERIFLVGTKPNARELLRAFDIFTLTSKKEGFPYVILEAAMAGLPVLASSIGGINEIITDMESGILTQPHNSKEVSRALDFMITNKRKRAELAQSLTHKVSGNFSLEKMLEKTVRLYQI